MEKYQPLMVFEKDINEITSCCLLLRTEVIMVTMQTSNGVILYLEVI